LRDQARERQQLSGDHGRCREKNERYAAKLDPAQWPFDARDLHGTSSQPNAHALTPSTAHTLGVAWTVDGDAVEGAPTVRDGIVYVGFFNDTAASFRLTDGSPIWATFLNGTGPIESAPGLANLVFITGGVTVPGLGPSDGIAALRYVDGSLVWAQPVGQEFVNATASQTCPVATPHERYVFAGTVSGQSTNAPQLPNGSYAFNFSGEVAAFDKVTGQLLWRFLNTNLSAGQSSGAVIGYTFAVDTERGLLFYGSGNSYSIPDTPLSCSLIALNYRTRNPQGELEWALKLNPNCVWSVQYPNASSVGASGFPRDLDAGSFPQLFTIDWGHKAGCVDVAGINDKGRNYTVATRDGGCQLWNVSVLTQPGLNPSIGGNPGSSFDVRNNQIITVGLQDPANLVGPEVVIAAARDQSFPAFVTILNGYTQLLNATVTALRADNGDKRWQRVFPGVILGSPSNNGRVVIVGTFSGELHILDARTGDDVVPPFLAPISPELTFLLGRPTRQPITTVPVIVEDETGTYVLFGRGFNFISGGITALRLHATRSPVEEVTELPPSVLNRREVMEELRGKMGELHRAFIH